MSFDQWLTKFNPNEITLWGFLVMAGLFFGLFTWRLVWPWFTKDYWPARAAERKARLDAEIEAMRTKAAAQLTIRDTLIEIRTAISQLVILNQNLSGQIEGVHQGVNLLNMGRGVPPALPVPKA